MKYLKKLIILILPTTFWFILMFLGFGHQSLSHIIEIPIIFSLSVFGVLFHSEEKYNTTKTLIILFILTFLIRLWMPFLPE